MNRKANTLSVLFMLTIWISLFSLIIYNVAHKLAEFNENISRFHQNEMQLGNK